MHATAFNNSYLTLAQAVRQLAPSPRVERLPPNAKTFQIDLRSDTVSWPHLFVPEYRGDVMAFARWWRNYLVWHAKVAGRIALAECKRAIESLLPVIVFTIGYTASIRTAKMQAIIDAIDAGASGGLNRWYDGVRPATGGAATTLLGTLTFSATCGTAAAGVLTFSAITSDTSADATATVTWGRVLDSTPTFCFDHSIGTAGGNDIVVNTAAVVTGAQLSITSWTITDGNP